MRIIPLSGKWMEKLVGPEVGIFHTNQSVERYVCSRV